MGAQLGTSCAASWQQIQMCSWSSSRSRVAQTCADALANAKVCANRGGLLVADDVVESTDLQRLGDVARSAKNVSSILCNCSIVSIQCPN